MFVSEYKYHWGICWIQPIMLKYRPILYTILIEAKSRIDREVFSPSKLYHMELSTTTHKAQVNTWSISLVFLVLFLSAGWLGCESKPPKEEVTTSEPEVSTPVTLNIDDKAVSILKRGLNYLSELDQFNVTTQSTYEDLLYDQFRIDFESSGDVTVDRPDNIRIERYGLEMHQLFYFDGDQFTLHNPYDKVYATQALKGTIEDMFHVARDTYGLSGPSADLIYSNSFDLLMLNVNGAEVIGKEMIGDVMCDHLLFTRPNVTFQIWISESEPFLPHKYSVTDTSTSNLLSFSTLMTSWDLSPKISESMFQYKPAADTQKIMFLKITESMN